VYLLDQWRQIGVTAENTPLDVAQQKAAYLNGNYEVGLDANCYDIDEPNSELLLYVSYDKSPINSSRYIDRNLDDLFDQQKRAKTEDERVRLIRAFEARVFEQGWTVPIVWWERIVAHDKRLKGWKLLPSHYLNQDWAQDAQRRATTFVPGAVTFAEKWRIGLGLLDRARADLPGGWVAGDDEFGRCTELRAALRQRRLRCVLDVPCHTLVRDPAECLLTREPLSGPLSSIP